MPISLLYPVLVVVWGSTWIMIRLQVGVVPPEASVAYRFVLASTLMFAWVAWRRLPLRFAPRDHLFLALQGMLIFSTNFVLFYTAADYLTTGLLAVVFSLGSAMTLLFGAIATRRRPPGAVLAGATMGVGGVALIFWPELQSFSLEGGGGLGLALSVLGTASFSLGGLVAARNQAAGLSVRGGTAWAMAYGAVLLLAFASVSGVSFDFDPSVAYVGSLLYLAILGSVVAFACYFALISRIGAARASYATVLFPVVALVISTVVEDYHWSWDAAFGVCLALIGNVVVLRLPQRASREANSVATRT